MPGRLGIDFGTSNTVLAVWDEARREGVPVHIADYGQLSEFSQAGEEPISVIPSLIHYAADRRRWVGNQVIQQNLRYDNERTFWWMKRYISNRSPIRKRLDGREVSHLDAGEDFLTAVLTFAAAQLEIANEEIALTVPVEAYEHYENWLAGVAEAAGLPRLRLIDEASAAALGYGAHIQPGNVYLIFDFGGGTLDVAVVLIEEEERALAGRRCRVLGKAGADIGGATLDGWLYQKLLEQNGRGDADEEVRAISKALLLECEEAKKRLSVHERADIGYLNPNSGAMIAAEFTRHQFEELLDEREVFTRLDQTIRRALNEARERGYGEADVQSVLMVGGSSLIPAVQKTVQRIFGKDRVMLRRPLDAVARGAAAFVAGVDFYDHIQHDYAVRWVNPKKGGYDYRVIVTRGTPYPTEQAIARLSVKATHDGQKQLGIAIFEIGEGRQAGENQAVELIFDPSGAARMVAVTADETARRSHFWVNEHSPTFLAAEPPARQGEARFAVEFGIDANKRLLITARDIQTSRITHKDYPVVKLT